MKYNRGRPVQQMGRSTQCFSIEDEGTRSMSEASSRWVGGHPEASCRLSGASLIIDPESESWVWRVGELKEKGAP